MPKTNGARGAPAGAGRAPQAPRRWRPRRRRRARPGPGSRPTPRSASTSGICSSAQAIVLSQATSSSISGGEDIVRQARLSASPQAAAISRIVLQRAAAERAGDDDRLARAAQHRRELRHVHALVGHVLRQPHRHHEVDVGEHLGDAGGARDVGLARPAAGAGLRVRDVEAVGPRSEIRAPVARARAVWRRRRGAAASSCAARQPTPALPAQPGCARGGRPRRRPRRRRARGRARASCRRRSPASRRSEASCTRAQAAWSQTLRSAWYTGGPFATVLHGGGVRRRAGAERASGGLDGEGIQQGPRSQKSLNQKPPK